MNAKFSSANFVTTKNGPDFFNSANFRFQRTSSAPFFTSFVEKNNRNFKNFHVCYKFVVKLISLPQQWKTFSNSFSPLLWHNKKISDKLFLVSLLFTREKSREKISNKNQRKFHRKKLLFRYENSWLLGGSFPFVCFSILSHQL